MNEPQTAERPILFSGPMVRAILEGRKTQTRRVVSHKFLSGPKYDGRGNWVCPYGAPGDRLWVRETWAPRDEQAIEQHDKSHVFYRADDETKYESDLGWKPSIHMPRWASRIDMEIVAVRVERVQEISEADAIEEGIERQRMGWKDCGKTGGNFGPVPSFASLWDSINAKRGFGWDVNPWIWCLIFKRGEIAVDSHIQTPMRP